MAVHIRIATSVADRADLHDVREAALEEQLQPESGCAQLGSLTAEIPVDSQDELPGTHSLVAWDDRWPIASLRVCLPQESGLPPSIFSAFDSIVRHVQGTVAGFDRLTLLKPWKDRLGLLLALAKSAVHIARAQGASHVLAMASVELAEVLLKAGFHSVGPPSFSRLEQRYLTPLYASIDEMQLPFAEWRVNPWIDALGAQVQRSIFESGEVVFLQGDSGDAAFLVARGSVGVTTTGPDGRELLLEILGPGALFGELALLDDEPRSATVRAYAEECDLLVMDRNTFRTAVLAHPDRAEALLRLLARRVRGTNKRAMSEQPHDVSPLLLQVLRDAARAQHITTQGLLPGSSIDWLAGKVGRPPSLVRLLMEALERRGLLKVRSDGIFLFDVSKLHGALQMVTGVGTGLGGFSGFSGSPFSGHAPIRRPVVTPGEMPPSEDDEDC